MSTRLSLIVSFAVLLSACSREAENAPATAAPPAAATAAPAPSLARKPSPAGARVYIISPRDGETVSSPVRVVFGLAGAGVAPAGIVKENTGHHHLLIDTPPPPLDQPIPADATHVHFGGGQTETTVTLTPGRHTLQLLLADELHVPHDPPLISDVVTIDVQ
jgi:hypothetical protein